MKEKVVHTKIKVLIGILCFGCLVFCGPSMEGPELKGAVKIFVNGTEIKPAQSQVRLILENNNTKKQRRLLFSGFQGDYVEFGLNRFRLHLTRGFFKEHLRLSPAQEFITTFGIITPNQRHKYRVQYEIHFWDIDKESFKLLRKYKVHGDHKAQDQRIDVIYYKKKFKLKKVDVSFI